MSYHPKITKIIIITNNMGLSGLQSKKNFRHIINICIGSTYYILGRKKTGIIQNIKNLKKVVFMRAVRLDYHALFGKW